MIICPRIEISENSGAAVAELLNHITSICSEIRGVNTRSNAFVSSSQESATRQIPALFANGHDRFLLEKPAFTACYPYAKAIIDQSLLKASSSAKREKPYQAAEHLNLAVVTAARFLLNNTDDQSGIEYMRDSIAPKLLELDKIGATRSVYLSASYNGSYLFLAKGLRAPTVESQAAAASVWLSDEWRANHHSLFPRTDSSFAVPLSALKAGSSFVNKVIVSSIPSIPQSCKDVGELRKVVEFGTNCAHYLKAMKGDPHHASAVQAVEQYFEVVSARAPLWSKNQSWSDRITRAFRAYAKATDTLRPAQEFQEQVDRSVAFTQGLSKVLVHKRMQMLDGSKPS